MRILLKIFFASFVLISTFESHAQKYDNSVHLEVFGNGGLYSVNYERRLLTRNKFSFAPSLGFTAAKQYFGFPLVMNAYFGGPNHSIETGIGHIGLFFNENIFYYGNIYRERYLEHFLTARVGYRYESDKGFLFKIAFTPLYHFRSGHPLDDELRDLGQRNIPAFTPSGGIGFGKSF